MFERYTEKARAAIVAAQDEARRLRHAYVGTEHILLGLLNDESSLASTVLSGLGVELVDMRERVGLFVGRGEDVVTGQIAFTPRSKRVLELGLREALSLGHNYVGAEHLLLGLVREWNTKDAGVAARVLEEVKLDAETIRNAVIRALSGGGPIPEDPGTPDRVKFSTLAGLLIPSRFRKHRCPDALTLYGATFVCQLEEGHADDEHVEHGDGWTMRWSRT